MLMLPLKNGRNLQKMQGLKLLVKGLSLTNGCVCYLNFVKYFLCKLQYSLLDNAHLSIYNMIPDYVFSEREEGKIPC